MVTQQQDLQFKEMNAKERQAIDIYFVTVQRCMKTHFSNRRLFPAQQNSLVLRQINNTSQLTINRMQEVDCACCVTLWYGRKVIWIKIII
jgi:hypothetical protein